MLLPLQHRGMEETEVKTPEQRWAELCAATTPIPPAGTLERVIYEAWVVARVEIWLNVTLAQTGSSMVLRS